MQQHQELELIIEHPQLPLRILIAIVAVAVAPFLEEMLFRGLVQTMIRSFFEVGKGAWLTIALSSGLFAIMHANAGHWPALFVLGVCLGYAYEKSGSLFRPVFIHSLFNATSIIATLNQ
jgi:membrane protease YdiL (CAAX protease family)